MTDSVLGTGDSNHRYIQCGGARKKTQRRDAAPISGEERTCITNRRSLIVMQMSSGEVKGRWTAESKLTNGITGVLLILRVC